MSIKYNIFTRHSSGFTMIEVMVAMFIFGFIVIVLLRALSTADRIHARSVIAMNSVLIAENDIEYVRKKIAFNEAVEDCTYTETIDKREYRVERHIIVPDSLLFENKKPSLVDIELTISPEGISTNSSLKFRFLQGTSW